MVIHKHISAEGSMSDSGTFSIEVSGVKRELRIFEINKGVRIALLNLLGDTELVQAAARGLAEKLSSLDYDIIVTAEAKSIPLAHELSVLTRKPYIVLRKSYKPYMGKVLKEETLSITTGKPQTLYLDEKDHAAIKGKRVLALDDVISTGSTLKSMRTLLSKAKAEVSAEAAIFTEGDQEKWSEIISLGHLPVFVD